MCMGLKAYILMGIGEEFIIQDISSGPVGTVLLQASTVGCNGSISRICTIASVHKKGGVICCDSFVHHCGVNGYRYIYTRQEEKPPFLDTSNLQVTEYYGNWKKALNC